MGMLTAVTFYLTGKDPGQFCTSEVLSVQNPPSVFVLGGIQTHRHHAGYRSQ